MSEITVNKIEKKKNTAELDKYDCGFAVVCIMLGKMYINLMFYDLDYFWSILQSRQIAFALYTFLYVAAVALYGRAKAAKPAKETIFWLFAMFLMCTFIPMQNADIPWLLLQTMLAMYFSYSFGNGFFKGETSNYFIGDCLNIVYMFFSRFFGIFKIIFRVIKKAVKITAEKIKDKNNFITVLAGLLIGLVCLAGILPLLSQADENFLSSFLGLRKILSHIFARLSSNIFELIFDLFTALPVACCIFSLNYNSFNKDDIHCLKKEKLDKSAETAKVIPNLTIKTAICMINIVYAIFMAAQFRYLFSAFAGKLYGGMTYAQYARSGFFQLCAVCAINGCVIAAAHFTGKERNGSRLKRPVIVMCLLSLLLLCTAGAKMAMYIAAYGLTPKRIISSLFLLWLMLVFAGIIISRYRQFNLVKISLFTLVAMFELVLCFNLQTISDDFNKKAGFNDDQSNSVQMALYEDYHENW